MSARVQPGAGSQAASGPLRVAVVCPYDLSRPGGVQGQAAGIARALRRAGHEAIVVAPDDRRPGWAADHVFAVGRAVGVRANGSVAPVSLSPAAAARAVRAVRDWGADVVHLHEPLAPATGYGFLLRARRPVVATFHRSGLGRAAALARPLARMALAHVDVRCAVSDAARRTAVDLCGGPAGAYEVLFNGVDTERVARARPAPSDRPAVLFLGRHEPRKGLSVLLEAFAGITRPAELWIAGSGPETERLRAAFPETDRIHWLGVLSDQEVADRLAGAALLCAPSVGGESFGMVLLEAMASGCQVVASDIPGYREAAAGHATLVRPGDPGAWRDAIDRVLADAAPGAAPDAVPGAARDAAPVAAARARAEGARRHAAEWSTDRLAARYVDLYRRAIAAHSPGGARAGRPAPRVRHSPVRSAGAGKGPGWRRRHSIVAGDDRSD